MLSGTSDIATTAREMKGYWAAGVEHRKDPDGYSEESIRNTSYSLYKLFFSEANGLGLEIAWLLTTNYRYVRLPVNWVSSILQFDRRLIGRSFFKLFKYLNFFPAQAHDLCSMENNKNIEETILTYTSAWNETERGVVLEKINRCWAPGGTYTDRLTDTITGPEAITDLIISSYGQMGPRKFEVLAEPQVHHLSGRFRWLAIRPGGYPVEGMDYFEFDSEHRITRIVGFF